MRLNNKYVLLILAAYFAATQCLAIQEAKVQKTVAIVQIVEHPALDATRQGILDELQDKKIKVEFQSAQGNSALATQIAQKFVGMHPDVMVGISTPAAQALVSANQQYSIPIVFSSVTDPKGAKIVQNLSAPEGAITGVSNYVDPGRQFDLFKKILPSLSSLGVIYNPGDTNSVILVEEMKKIAALKGLTLVFATANNSADIAQAAQKLLPKVQALFINNDNTALSAFDAIVRISTQQNIPVFCSDVDMVDHGALAALGANQYEIGRETGKLILKILQGQSPKQIPVMFPKETETRINAAQAAKLGIKIPD